MPIKPRSKHCLISAGSSLACSSICFDARAEFAFGKFTHARAKHLLVFGKGRQRTTCKLSQLLFEIDSSLPTLKRGNVLGTPSIIINRPVMSKA